MLTACMDAKMGLVRMEESRWEHRMTAGPAGSLSYRGQNGQNKASRVDSSGENNDKDLNKSAFVEAVICTEALTCRIVKLFIR